MAWNDLTLSDKARMIQMAVRSGITDLRVIHDVYNKYADGGSLHEFKKGGSMEDSSIRFDDEESYYKDGGKKENIDSLYTKNNEDYIKAAVWRNSLPDNLKYPALDYDYINAYRSGIQPTLEEDGYYHLGSRNPKTGEILKKPGHPTFEKAIMSDIDADYWPRYFMPNGNIVTVNDTVPNFKNVGE